jgi:hypothetical protein
MFVDPHDKEEMKRLGVLFSISTMRRRQKAKRSDGKPAFPRFVHPSPGRIALVREEVLENNAFLISERDRQTVEISCTDKMSSTKL